MTAEVVHVYFQFVSLSVCACVDARVLCSVGESIKRCVIHEAIWLVSFNRGDCISVLNKKLMEVKEMKCEFWLIQVKIRMLDSLHTLRSIFSFSIEFVSRRGQ